MGEELDGLFFTPRFAPRTRPLPIPGVDAFDLPRVCVELNPFWVSHILGALEVLDQPDAWEGDTEAVFQARQQVREIMLALTQGNCEGGASLFDVRQSENEPCILEKTLDGLTWTPFAMLDLCAQEVTPPERVIYDDLRENPTTGEPEFSLDGGTTWTPIAQPPGTPPTSPWAPARSPQPGATQEEQRCMAASSAANALNQMYLQTYGAIAAGVFTTLSEINAFMSNLNYAIAGIVWGTYWDVIQALGFAQEYEPTQYVATGLNEDQIQKLICLLYDNATVGNLGVVSFNFGAVRDNVVSELGLNPGTAIWTHLNYVQEAGLNRLGEVGFGNVDDCGLCELEPGYQFNWTHAWCSTQRASEVGPGQITFPVGWTQFHSCFANFVHGEGATFGGNKTTTVHMQWEGPTLLVDRLDVAAQRNGTTTPSSSLVVYINNDPTPVINTSVPIGTQGQVWRSVTFPETTEITKVLAVSTVNQDFHMNYFNGLRMWWDGL